MEKRRGQVWVETVIYTLIALVMIGAVLAFAKPKIEEMQDRALIEQTIEMLEQLDGEILSIIQGGPGNQREIRIQIKKGSLDINATNNKLIFEIEGRDTFSDPGNTNVFVGEINVFTEERGKFNKVTLTRDYSDYDIQYGESNAGKILGKSPTPYKLIVLHKGGDPAVINFEVE